MMTTRNRLFATTSMYYALFFMAGGGFSSYIGLYFASVNLSNTQIGLIASIGILAGIIGQPIWGTIADRSKNKTRMLNIMNFVAAMLIWFIPVAGNSFYFILIAMMAFSFFGNSVMPIGDSITLELAKQEGFKFSTVRFIGSVGFALMAAVAGKLLAIDIRYMFVIFFVLRLLSSGVSFFIPKVPGHPKTDEHNDSFFDLFKDKKLNIIYIYVFLLSSTMGYFNAFHTIYSKEIGIPLELIGLGVMVGSFSQFPFSFFFDWIYERIGFTAILIISGCVYVLRWFLYAFFLNEHTILILWALHGMTFIVMYLCLADYVNVHVPKRLKTRGQMMNNIVILGASAIAGSLIGGIASQHFGMKETFFGAFIFAAITLAGFIVTVICIPGFFRRGPRGLTASQET